MSSEPKELKDAKQESAAQESHYMRLIVLLFVPVLLLVIAAPLLWNMSQQSADTSSTIVHYMLSDDEIAGLASDAGYVATGDEVTSVLLAVTTEDSSELSGAALITVDDTQSSAKLIEVDSNMTVTCDDQTETLDDTYQSSGAQGVAYVVAHAGMLCVDNIVEMDTSSWDIVRSAVEAGSDSLAVDIPQLLEGVKENDMSVSTMREVLTRALSYGFSAESIAQIPSTGGALDIAQIGILAGSIKKGV